MSRLKSTLATPLSHGRDVIERLGLSGVGGIGDFECRGVAKAQGISADFAAGEFAGDAALLIDVAMIALDSGFRSVDEFLGHEFKAGGAQLRPKRTQRLGIFSVKSFA